MPTHSLPPTPFRFTFVRPLEMGFALESADVAHVWPRFANVLLRIAPTTRGEGMYFHYRPPENPRDRLPDWAVRYTEMGALHATLVGGPGGLQVADLQIDLIHGEYDPIASGDRAFFLAGYLGTRQLIHEAVRVCPAFLEVHQRLTFAVPTLAEPRVIRELYRQHGSGIELAHSQNGLWTRITVDMPVLFEPPLIQFLASLTPTKQPPPIEREPLRFRALTVSTVPELLKKYGPPVDWPPDTAPDGSPAESQFPLIGDPFPDLPTRHIPVPHAPPTPTRKPLLAAFTKAHAAAKAAAKAASRADSDAIENA